MDDSIAALIAMCVLFFLIAVGALLLYLTQYDRLQIKDDTIAQYAAEKQVLEDEMAAMTKRQKEAAGNYSQQPSLDHRKSQVRSAPRSAEQARWERKSVVARALRLQGSSASRPSEVVRRCYNRWLRHTVNRCPLNHVRKALPGPALSPMRPVEYYSASDFGGGGSGGAGGGFAGAPPQYYTKPPQFVRYGAGSPEVHPSGLPQTTFSNPGASVHLLSSNEVYTAGGAAGIGSLPYPSAVRYLPDVRREYC